MAKYCIISILLLKYFSSFYCKSIWKQKLEKVKLKHDTTYRGINIVRQNFLSS